MDVTPLYRVVEQHIRQRISTGELVPGDLIPSEPQLARSLDVSQGTVKKAIDNLVSERLLFRHQGKGTYVSRINFNNSLFRFFAYGGQGGTKARIRKETPVRRIKRGPAEVCRRLDLPAGSELVYIERVGFVEQDPVLIEKSWLDATHLRGLENEALHIPDLMYAVIVEKFGVPVVRAEETLTAEAADKTTAKTLCVQPNDPLVVLIRLTYTLHERPIEYRVTRGRADRFSYKTEIR